MLYQHLLLRNSVNNGERLFGSYLDLDYFTEPDFDYYRVNVRRFHTMMTDVTTSFMPVIQHIVMNSLTHRSVIPPKLDTCVSAKKVANELAIMFKKSFEYVAVPPEDGKLAYYQFDYYAALLSMIAILIQDDRDSECLITPLIVAFEDNGVVSYLLQDLFGKHRIEMILMTLNPHYDKTLLQRMQTFFEMSLSIFYYFVSASLYHDSPHSMLLTDSTDEEEQKHGEPVNLYLFATNMRLKLSTLALLIQVEEGLLKLTKHGIHMLLKCVGQLFDLKGEVDDYANHLMKSGVPYHLANIMALKSMGFDRIKVDKALREHQYGLCALDYLISEDGIHENDGLLRLKISPDLESSDTLTPEELASGTEILVKMGYKSTQAKESLQKHNDIHKAIKELNGEPVPVDTGENTTSEAVDGKEENEVEDPNATNDDPLRYIYKKEKLLTAQSDSKNGISLRNLTNSVNYSALKHPQRLRNW